MFCRNQGIEDSLKNKNSKIRIGKIIDFAIKELYATKNKHR